MAGKSAIRDAPAVTTMPPPPLSPFGALHHCDPLLPLIADIVRVIFRCRVLRLRARDAPPGRVTAANQFFVQGGSQQVIWTRAQRDAARPSRLSQEASRAY